MQSEWLLLKSLPDVLGAGRCGGSLRGRVNLRLLYLEAVLMRCMFHAACIAVGHLDCTQVRELAWLVGACVTVESEAQGLVAMLELLHEHPLAFCALALALACAFVDYGWLRSRLQQCMHVATQLGEFEHCLLRCPAVCGECHDLRPDFAVRAGRLCGVDCAEA